MAWPTYTVSQIAERVKQDLAAKLDDSDPWVKASVEAVLAATWGTLAYSQHRHIEREAGQVVPHRSVARRFWDWFTFFGLTRKIAVQWKGTIEVTSTGATVPALQLMTRGDGRKYFVPTSATIAGPTDTISVWAVDVGSDGTCEIGTTLSFLSPIPGVESDTTVNGSTQDGTDIESEDDGKSRLLVRVREGLGGGGGSPGDYRNWALEVPGVTRAWEYPQADGPGTVAVAFVRDNDVTIIPDSSEKAAVQAYVQAKSPPIEEIVIRSLTENVINVSISGLTPDTPEIRTAVENELAEEFLAAAEPGGTMYKSNLDAAISAAKGETSHSLDSPAGDTTSGGTEIPVLGTVTFT